MANGELEKVRALEDKIKRLEKENKKLLGEVGIPPYHWQTSFRRY